MNTSTIILCGYIFNIINSIGGKRTLHVYFIVASMITQLNGCSQFQQYGQMKQNILCVKPAKR